MISAMPSSYGMLGIQALSIKSPEKTPHTARSNGGPKSLRVNGQPRPKLIPALKPSPRRPIPPLRRRRRTATAGTGG